MFFTYLLDTTSFLAPLPLCRDDTFPGYEGGIRLPLVPMSPAFGSRDLLCLMHC